MLINRMLSRRVAAGRISRSANDDVSRKLLIKAMWPATWRTAVGPVMSVGLSQGMSVAAANLLTAAEAEGVQRALRNMQIISQSVQTPFYTRIPSHSQTQSASGTTQQQAPTDNAKPHTPPP